MSAGVYAREGYNAMLLAWQQGSVLYAHLYVNDPTISADLTAADMQEPEYQGYLPISLNRWTPPALRAGVSIAVHDPLIWEWGGGDAPLPIRGYYVTAGPAGPIVWAWRRPGEAFPLGPGFGVLVITVRMTFPFVAL